MEIKQFTDKYTLEKFFAEELPALLTEKFPYLEFIYNKDRIGVCASDAGMNLDIWVKGKDLVKSNGKSWTPSTNESALNVVSEIVTRDPGLAYSHTKQEVERLDAKMDLILEKLEQLLYMPGGPGYEEAKKDFEARV
nr:hypothetical protein K-LCC10_0254 [Kaumoebavirus]